MKGVFLIMCVLAALSTGKSQSLSMNIILAVMSLGFALLAIYMHKMGG